MGGGLEVNNSKHYVYDPKRNSRKNEPTDGTNDM